MIYASFAVIYASRDVGYTQAVFSEEPRSLEEVRGLQRQVERQLLASGKPSPSAILLSWQRFPG